MPPSAITGVPVFFASSTESMIAVICGTPTPATMRVVQIEPGPMPTLMQSAPASISALAPSAVAMLPATTCTLLESALDAVDRVEHVARMPVRGVDHHEIDAGRDQRLGAGEALVADRGGGGDAQAALLVLAGVRIGDRLLDVLHGDQADAAVVLVDHQQLLDAVLVQEPLRLLLRHAFAHRDQLVLGHQLGDRLLGIGREAHVAVGQDADQLAGAAIAAALHHRNAGDAVRLHQVERLGQLGARADGERVHHHAGFEALHPPHLLGLHLGLEIAVDHADAAGLRHGDRHVGLGHGVHRGRDDRDVERDVAGDAAADIDLGRQHLGQARLEQHVVEGQRQFQGRRSASRPLPTPLARRDKLGPCAVDKAAAEICPDAELATGVARRSAMKAVSEPFVRTADIRNGAGFCVPARTAGDSERMLGFCETNLSPPHRAAIRLGTAHTEPYGEDRAQRMR